MKVMLRDLLPDVDNLPELTVSGLQVDSRSVEPGDVFLAMPGDVADGRDYISEAAQRSAALVLCESPAPHVEVGIPVIEVSGLREQAGEIASRFYARPSADLFVTAVTGTNGKTSTSHYIAQALNTLQQSCGLIGTLGAGIPGRLSNAGLTTPDSISVQRLLRDLAEQGCQSVVLEASSHGLAQGRLNGTGINIGVFTNITRDHLDYHDDFSSYQDAKRQLFVWPGLEAAVINIDDEFGETLAGELSDIEVITTSVTNKKADVHCKAIKSNNHGFQFTLVTPWGSKKISVSLLGRFNISNLLGAAAVLGLRGFDIDSIASAMEQLEPVKGRMELLPSEDLALVVIDYAHTPDALEKALLAVREHGKGEVWCVFGCGGDRDKGKRPLMGEVASRLSSHVMITDDNPRGEASRAIANDIIKGVKPGVDVEVVTDRTAAIYKVLGNAALNDVVLIAGKGHEEYQDVSGRRLEYSDHRVVHDYSGKL